MKRKKIFLVTLMTLFLFQGATKAAVADTLEYPVESIRIVEAETFQVTVPSTIQSDSILYSNVEVDEILNIFIGGLALIQGGQTQRTSMIIVSNVLEEDFARYLVNSYGRNDTLEGWSYAWQILIDTEIGVYKDLTLLANMKEFSVTHTFDPETWEFKDDKNVIYPTVENSFERVENLDIEIAAYSPEFADSELSPSARIYRMVSFLANFGLTGCTNQNSSSSYETNSLEGLAPLTHETIVEQLSQRIKAVFE